MVDQKKIPMDFYLKNLHLVGYDDKSIIGIYPLLIYVFIHSRKVRKKKNKPQTLSLYFITINSLLYF